ncbi:hypothetical protein GN956_G8300 [Arapaima gigas]
MPADAQPTITELGTRRVRPCAPLSWFSPPWPSSCAGASATRSIRTQKMSVKRRKTPSLHRNEDLCSTTHQQEGSSLDNSSTGELSA